MKHCFPDNFVWGSATASYQIEGAVNEDGRGESIWDRFSSIPGNIADGSNGDVACDHYHRWKEDVQLMRAMGMNAYRFSIAWPRIFPEGVGEVNEKGLAFYDQLIDELLANGIEPYVTLYHWDLPQKLQDQGGWTNPKMPEYFLEYSKVVLQRYGKKVRYWTTLNEPYCAAFLGYYEGRHAPGIRDFSAAVLAAYHLYVGHGLVVRYFRESGLKGQIGITLNLMGRLPYSEREEDQAAAIRADGYLNRWFAQPIFQGSYPEDMVKLYRRQGVRLPEFTPENLALISQKLDFVGLNYYNDFYVQEDWAKWPLGFVIKNPPQTPVTDRAWPITENGLESMLLRMKNEYGINNIFITENGASYNDHVSLNGQVEDTNRRDYLHRHLLTLHHAIEAGADVKGYFVWSTYDNFEWGCGFASRFGLAYVDFHTQQRIIKESGKWLAGVIQANGLEA